MAISFLSGVLVDLDHILDFLFNHSIKKHRDFFNILYACDIKKYILFFHSYEFLIILVSCILIIPSDKYWVSFAIGFGQHLILDAFTNPIRPWGYFLAYRIYSGFERKKILKISYLEKEKVRYAET